MAWYMEWLQYAEAHMWVPVVAGSLAVLIILFFMWRCRCCCFARSTRTRYAALVNGHTIENGIVNNYGAMSSRVPPELPGNRGGNDAEKQAMAVRAQYFLRENRQFKLLQHLPQVGNRTGKAWFVVKPNRYGDQMMSMSPATEQTLLPLNPKIKQAMRDLILLLQHPYVMPVNHFDVLAEQNHIVVMTELSIKGSVRDLLHGANPIVHNEKKYRLRGKPLTLKRVAQIGRQILEALQFLKSRKFAYRHLHSGNVMFSGGVFRISGLEQQYFGHSNHDDKLITKALDKTGGDTSSPWDYDIICFGRLLFEMALGYELRSSVPDVEQLVGKCEYQVIEILVLIFFHPDQRVPSVEELLEQQLFKSVKCSELERYMPPPMVLTDEIKAILKAGRKLKTTIKKTVKKSGKSRRRRSEDSMTSPSYNPEFSAPDTSVSVISPVSSVPPSPAPPPPPPSEQPPPPPPPQSSEDAPPPVDSGRGSLLSSIRQGKSLKRVETVDKSGPML